MCRSCYNEAMKAEQMASVPLPGTVNVSRCSRVTADVGTCSVCGIAKAVWIDREAGVKLTGAEPNIAKLSMSKITKLAGELGLSLQGPAGMLWGDPNADPGMAEMFLFAPATSIYGGTDEVQKNIIGERVLGLPQEIRTDKDVAFKDIGKNL